MRIVTAADNGKSLQISRAEWLRIGERAGWMKTAQPDPRRVEVIGPDEVTNVIDSLGTTRFMIGYRKKNGEYRVMHAQRRVNKFKDEPSTPGYSETRQEHGLILVYDLDVARKTVGELQFNPDESDEERQRIKERALRRSYRSIYPHKVEMIRGGGGRTWLVETAENPDILRMIDEVLRRPDPDAI